MQRSTEIDRLPPTGDPSGAVICVHCLVQSARKPPLAGAPPGLDGSAPLRLLSADGGLWLVVSAVSLEHYDAPAIELGLRDMDWVSRHALAHENVVAHFLEHGALVPMKLFTLYRGEERARADVATRRAQIDAVLEEVRGKREWGVRILAASAAPEPSASHPTLASDPPPSGTEFLRRKQVARSAAQLAASELQGRAEELFGRFEPLATRVRRREPLPAAAGSRLILDAALLVATRRSAAFVEAARQSAAEAALVGLELVLSGPWAAYNFVEPPE